MCNVPAKFSKHFFEALKSNTLQDLDVKFACIRTQISNTMRTEPRLLEQSLSNQDPPVETDIGGNLVSNTPTQSSMSERRCFVEGAMFAKVVSLLLHENPIKAGK